MNYPPPPPPPGFPPNPGGPGAFGPPPGPPGGGGYGGGGGNYGGGGGFGPPPPPPFMGQSGTDWDVGEVLQSAWEAFKVCWGPLVGALFLSGFISQIPGLIARAIQGVSMGVADAGRHHSSSGSGSSEDLAMPILMMVIVFVGTIIGWAIGCFFHVGMTRMWCSAARRESVDFGELFRGGNRFLHLLAAQFLMGLAIVFASLLLIVPGIILSYGLMLTQFYVVDAEMGPIEAMKASWETTTGQKGKLFVLSLAFFALGIAGLLCCCLGVYVAAPVCSVALAIVYVRLSGRMGAGGGMTGGMGGPPPGFGPPPAAFGPPPGAFGPPPPAGGFGGGGGGYGPPGGGGPGGYGPPR